MNRKLILQLSLFGLAMAFATISIIPSKVEPAFWLVIFIFCAYQIASKCNEKYFLTGLLVSLVNSVWITGAHVLFFDKYLAAHPEMLTMNASMPMPEHPRVMMLVMGPVFGLVSGIVLGLFALIASKIIKR